MLPPVSSKHKSILFAILCLFAFQGLTRAQEASQLGFTDLQVRANALVERGQLEEALPLLKELIDRVEKAEESEIQLDFPIFLVGTGHIQRYVNSGEESDLVEALQWYEKLEADYPETPRLKDALLKKVDVLRTLQQYDAATDLMEALLSGKYPFRLNYAEETKLLKDLTQTLYATGKLEKGLPYFARLLETSRDPDEQVLAAAASFEALFEAKRMDEAIRLLPVLARESEIRYRPRLNVALLRASDTLVEADRLTDATILLNLIKTTDLMIEYHEAQLADTTTRLEQRQAFGGSQDEVQRLQQEIKTLESNLEQLRTLPTLRNELLVRRARNYTKTERRFEAFWMFYDLMIENPDDAQTEFFHYAAFSNALQIGKEATVVEIGRRYRAQFPKGEYYSDVSAALARALKARGDGSEFLELSVDFLTQRPKDPVAPALLAEWAGFLFSKGEFTNVREQTGRWQDLHQNPIFEDGLHYWGGMADLQLGDFEIAEQRFDRLLKRFPTSVYAEDALLRKGAALFYAQKFEAARNTLLEYTTTYPQGSALDQAYYFLGEVASLAGELEQALAYFDKAYATTSLQDIFDAVAFKVGTIYEAQERYDDMAAHFQAYIDRFGEAGRLTDAVFQLGRAYEFAQKPNAMLSLYRESIEKYVTDPDNAGIDRLIESYTEKYAANHKVLSRTVEFLDRLVNDLDFREKIVTDRGFLFEHFYLNPELDQALYNRLRNHPEFGRQLMDGLAPIENLTGVYRRELADFPKETPEDFFRRLLPRYATEGNRIAEARLLMGLYRIGVELAPKTPFDRDFLSQLTPRLLLYVADYSRQSRREFAVEAWNEVLHRFPSEDAAIVAYMRLADVNEQDGDQEGAFNRLESIVNQFPGSPKLPSVILRQGELLSAMGQAREAREKYQYILRVPDWRGVVHARALYQTGEAYMAENKYAEAHGFFERTFLGYSHFGEWSARAYLADAEALLALSKKTDAVNTLREGIGAVKDSAPAELVTSLRAKLKELE